MINPSSSSCRLCSMLLSLSMLTSIAVCRVALGQGLFGLTFLGKHFSTGRPADEDTAGGVRWLTFWSTLAQVKSRVNFEKLTRGAEALARLRRSR